METASNCVAGLETFEAAYKSNEPFDLAILDLNMPDFSGRLKDGAGFDLLRRVHALQTDLPVIILTAYDVVTMAKEAVSEGVKAYIVKGRDQELIAKIHEVLGV